MYKKYELFLLEFYSNISAILTLFESFLNFHSLQITITYFLELFSSIILLVFIYFCHILA